MDLQEQLKDICQQVPGCRAVTIMNLDGLVVMRHQARPDGVDDEVLMVEMTSAVRQMMQAITSVEGGELIEFGMQFDKGSVLVRPLQDEHFVALLLDPDALVGKGRFVLRQTSLPLIQQLF